MEARPFLCVTHSHDVTCRPVCFPAASLRTTAPAAATSPHQQQHAEATLAARVAGLQAQVAERNELTKLLMDQLRQMLESMSMWDAHKAQLERMRQQAER